MNIQRKQWQMSRRTFLRATGVSLSLPWLEAMGANSASVSTAGSLAAAEIPRRAYFSHWGFFEVMAGVPKDTGLDYTLTPTLSAMAPFKQDFTLISDLDRPQQGLLRVSQQSMEELQIKLHQP